MMKKLLLHTCCAPCAIYPLEEAKKDNYYIRAYFYNPNIHPRSEYEKRQKVAGGYFESEAIEMISPEYNAGDFFGRSMEDRIPPERCSICWDMRLEKTVSFAKETGFDAFTTTLLGSPYQDHQILKKICQAHSKAKGVDFYYKDFRTGFREAHRLARQRGIYCQNYCGCIFSMVERQEKVLRPR